VQFFLDLIVHLSHKIIDPKYEITWNDEDLSGKERLWLTTVLMSDMFEEFARGDGFVKFANVGGIGEPSKAFFRDYFWDKIVEHMELVSQSLCHRNPGVTPDTIQPYVHEDNAPNVLSALHLIAQGLCFEHVYFLTRNAS